MIPKSHYICVVVLFTLIETSCDIPTNQANDSDLRFLLDIINQAYSELDSNGGCRESTDDDGSLAWGGSYLLRSYLSMYQATGNLHYLDKFVHYADYVVASTDTLRGIRDYLGRSRTGWSSTKYSAEGERVRISVHCGMITLPLLEFALLVRQQFSLMFRYHREYRMYIITAKNALDEFDDHYRLDISSGEGHIAEPPNSPLTRYDPSTDRHVPINWNAAMGRSYLLLWRLTGESIYRDRVLALARYIKKNLVAIDTHYEWYFYSEEASYLSPSKDDMSHGAIAVTFAVMAYESGLGFNRQDMEYFASTLIHTSRSDGFSVFVDGTGIDNVLYEDVKCGITWLRKYSDASGRWLDLSPYSSELYRLVHTYLLSRVRDPIHHDPHIMFGIAQLSRYYRFGQVQ